MDPVKDITTAVTAALRAAGARGRSASPGVRYRRGHVEITQWGGPPSRVVEEALAPLLAQGRLTSLTVTYLARYSCGAFHDSPVHAWFAHEGSDHTVHIDTGDCELGCDHGGDYLDADAVAALVAAGETFTSRVCTPLPPG